MAGREKIFSAVCCSLSRVWIVKYMEVDKVDDVWFCFMQLEGLAQTAGYQPCITVT